ncbi:MAG: hypothetical protein ACE5IL_17640, partial [Myxococcota bacterium]
MRSSIALLLQGTRLLGASLAGHPEGAERVEQQVRRLALGDGAHLHAALMHFSLGNAFLRQERPYRALLHGRQGWDEAQRAGSFAARALCQVLRAQALADLKEDEEAHAQLRACLSECDDKGLLLLSEAAAVEIAALAARRGETDLARMTLGRIRRQLPPGRPRRSSLRPLRFAEELIERLRPRDGHGPRWCSRVGEPRPVQVVALGTFRLTVRGHTIYDRRWRSGRSQRLLKLLLTLGGEKVSAVKLAELMWPDADGDRAYASLKTALARLRRTGLRRGDPPLRWIHWKHGLLSLAEPLVEADVLAFRELARVALARRERDALEGAIALYRGEFLPGEEEGVFALRRSALRGAHVALVEAWIAATSRPG